ncbi:MULTISPECIES: YjcZ family sporulation protein [unclassified Paenibacillus]
MGLGVGTSCGSFFTSTATILVLFILLVIVSRSFI